MKQKKARDHKPPKNVNMDLACQESSSLVAHCFSVRMKDCERNKERKEMTMAMAMTRFFYNNSSFVLFSHPIDWQLSNRGPIQSPLTTHISHFTFRDFHAIIGFLASATSLSWVQTKAQNGFWKKYISFYLCN